jgi:uncharacterized protein (DUF983 family)
MAPLTKCPSCGRESDRANASYCNQCGARLDAVPAGSHGFGVAFMVLLVATAVTAAIWLLVKFAW